MAQNLISLQLSQDQLTQADTALTTLEQVLGGLVSLLPDDRRQLTKMGQKSEVFCRQAISVLANNPQIVPPSLNVADAIADLKVLDQLRPLLQRLSRLAEKGTDTEMALGADLMSVSLEGYALLKVSGRQQGLDGLRKEMGARWSKGRRVEVEEADPA
jgi:hypothetical protein